VPVPNPVEERARLRAASLLPPADPDAIGGLVEVAPGHWVADTRYS
jgi:peptide/nickel transport system ATP-binding protein